VSKPYFGLHEYPEFYSKEIKAWVPAEITAITRGADPRTLVGRDSASGKYVLINTLSGNGYWLKGSAQPNGATGIRVPESIVPRLFGVNGNKKLIRIRIREVPERLQLAARELTIIENTDGQQASSQSAERTEPESQVAGVSTQSSPVAVKRWVSNHIDGARGNIRTSPSGETVVSILSPGEKEWSTQAAALTDDLQDGQLYIVNFSAKADSERRAVVTAQEDGPPYAEVGAKPKAIMLGTEYQRYQITFRAQSVSGKTVRVLALNLGGTSRSGPGIVSLKDLTVQKHETEVTRQ